MASKRNKIHFLRPTNDRTSTPVRVEFIAVYGIFLFFWIATNVKWDGTRIIFNLKLLCMYVWMSCANAGDCLSKTKFLLAWKWSGIFSLKRFIWNTFSVIFSHFFRYWAYFFFPFELTNKPHIKTSYVSFCLEWFSLEIVLRSWRFLFSTLFYIIFASLVLNLLMHSFYSFFHFILFQFDSHCITLHFECTEKCGTFDGVVFVCICVPLFKLNVQLLEVLRWEKLKWAGSLWLNRYRQFCALYFPARKHFAHFFHRQMPASIN